VHVISRKILRDYCQSHADVCGSLYDWYRVASKAQWNNLTEVQVTYKNAETVGNFTVFNIKGNRYRLIVDIIYPSQRIYLKYILTYAEYDKRCDPASAQDARECAPRRINGKMTLITNPESYAQLLAKYQPKVIETAAENDRAIALAQELEHKTNRTPQEDALLELLVALIEKFEDEQYPIPSGTPHSMLLHLMEASDLKQENLIGVIGSRGVVSEVVNGKRNISKAQAKALAKFYSVDVGLFI
jgi:HTH-type transcriptional regulator / antitoxin HigA